MPCGTRFFKTVCLLCIRDIFRMSLYHKFLNESCLKISTDEEFVDMCYILCKHPQIAQHVSYVSFKSGLYI